MEPVVPYSSCVTEIEDLGLEALKNHRAKSFRGLPKKVQAELLERQDAILAKWGMSLEDYADAEGPFITLRR